MDAEDLALIEAFGRGQEAAFTALVIKYRETVYRTARRMVHNHEDASDIAQEVFIRVHRALPQFAGRSQFRTWLYRITVNLCLDYKSRVRPLLAELSELTLEAPAHENPIAIAEQRELSRAIASAVDELPPRQRAMAILRLYQDLPYADIASIMGCSEGTVKATMFAALGKLRKTLAPLVERRQ